MFFYVQISDTEQIPQNNNYLLCLLNSASQSIIVDDPTNIFNFELIDIKTVYKPEFVGIST